jgi:hypothetical protein
VVIDQMWKRWRNCVQWYELLSRDMSGPQREWRRTCTGSSMLYCILWDWAVLAWRLHCLEARLGSGIKCGLLQITEIKPDFPCVLACRDIKSTRCAFKTESDKEEMLVNLQLAPRRSMNSCKCHVGSERRPFQKL